MLPLVFFAFLFTLFLALSISWGISLLELTDLQCEFSILDSETDGQFGIASLQFGWGIQNLIWVVRSQGTADFVAFRLTGETSFLAALDLSLEVITGTLTFQASNEGITIARVLIGRHAILE